jgi:hypothetical protein
VAIQEAAWQSWREYKVYLGRLQCASDGVMGSIHVARRRRVFFMYEIPLMVIY